MLSNPDQLLQEGPRQLIGRPLDEYVAAMRLFDDLKEEHLEAVDYVVRNRVVDLLTKGAGEKELEEAYSQIRRLIPVAREDEWARWKLRWNGMADIIGTHLEILSNPPRQRMSATR